MLVLEQMILVDIHLRHKSDDRLQYLSKAVTTFKRMDNSPKG